MAEHLLDIQRFGGLNFGPQVAPQECGVCINLDDTNAPALRSAYGLEPCSITGEGAFQGAWVENGEVQATVRENNLIFEGTAYPLTDCNLPRRFLRISPSAVLILPDRYLFLPKAKRVRPFDNCFTAQGTVESVIGNGVRVLLEQKPQTAFSGKVYVSGLNHVYYDEETYPNSTLLWFEIGSVENLANGKCRMNLNAEFRTEDGKLGYIDTATAREITIRQVLPELTDAVVCRNRLWGVAGKKLVASKLGDPMTFDDFSGLSTDSFELPMEQPLTAVSHFGERVVFMSKTALYELYGDRPSNYQVSAPKVGGCHYPESVCNADGYLLYADREHLYRYGGSNPQPITASLEFPRWSHVFGVSDGNTCLFGLDGRLFRYRPSGNRFFELPFSATGGLEAEGERYFFNTSSLVRLTHTRSQAPYHYRSGWCSMGTSAPKELLLYLDGARPQVSLVTKRETRLLTAMEDRGDGILRLPFPADLGGRIFAVDIQGVGDACLHRITVRG